jgi:hypothetical protein
MPMAKKKMNPLEKVAKRFNITTREVRDIVTAASTLGRSVVDKNVTTKNMDVMKRGKYVDYVFDKKELRSRAGRNLAKQVGEVYTAATKGKSGTKSAKIKSVKTPKSGYVEKTRYATETKRKQGGKK